MYQAAWDEIESVYDSPRVAREAVEQFRNLKVAQDTHTKKEGNLEHYCAFFLPYDQSKGMIYLGHHKKADDWIPPGGHIEPSECPSDAAVREMQEELGVAITKDMLEPFSLSVKPIGRPDKGCVTHYDMWFLVHTPVQNFDFDKREYYDAGWFHVVDGVKKIKKNPDFAAIVAKLK